MDLSKSRLIKGLYQSSETVTLTWLAESGLVLFKVANEGGSPWLLRSGVIPMLLRFVWAKTSKTDPRRGGFGVAAIYEGQPDGGGEDWRCAASDRSRSGGQVQRARPGGSDRSQGSGTAAASQRRAPGRPRGDHRERPDPAVHGVVRWWIVDLRQWIFEEFRVVVSRQTLSRELRAMGYRKLSARPRHHAQAAGAIEDQTPPLACTNRAAERRRSRGHRGLGRRRGARRPEEQDHPPLGQARHASERSRGRANRFRLYLGDPPQYGKGAALVTPRCDTEAMTLHLAEIATQIAPGAHAALLVDQGRPASRAPAVVRRTSP